MKASKGPLVLWSLEGKRKGKGGKKALRGPKAKKCRRDLKRGGRKRKDPHVSSAKTLAAEFARERAKSGKHFREVCEKRKKGGVMGRGCGGGLESSWGEWVGGEYISSLPLVSIRLSALKLRTFLDSKFSLGPRII